MLFASPAHSDPGNLASLHRILQLRWISIGGQLVCAPASTLLSPGAGWSPWPIVALCASLALLNILFLMRARHRTEVGHTELALQLLLDAAALTIVVHLSGGAGNPIITLYLPLVAIAAAILPAGHAAVVTVASIAAYSALVLLHATPDLADHAHAFRQHLIGMWLVFVLSATIIAWFVLRMTAALRARDHELAAAREATLRDERIVALGSLAAGAAHELGTPLGTLAILAGELADDPALPVAAKRDLGLMRAQVEECKRILTRMAARAGAPRAESGRRIEADRWIEQLAARWRSQRPWVQPAIALRGERPGPRIIPDATVEHALLNLFNNAADASPGEVEIVAHWDADGLQVDVFDRGPGIPEALRDRLGHDTVTTREDGHGLGLVLASAAIERSGGALSFSSRPEGGTRTSVRLPLAV